MDIKTRLRQIFYPHTIIVALLFNLSVVLLLYAFLAEDVIVGVDYLSYFISAYTLVIVCLRMPGVYRKGKAVLYRNRVTNRYLTDKELRLRFSLYLGLAINAGFAIMKVVFGFLYNSAWLYAVAGYNMILSIIRFFLVRRDMSTRKSETEEERRIFARKAYRLTGYLMCFLNVAISVIVIMVVVHNQTIIYHEFVIYAIAAYSFYSIGKAIFDVIKYRNHENRVFTAIKEVAFAKALVSIFTMQVAMLTQFGGEMQTSFIFNLLTGIAVIIGVSVLTSIMLRRGMRDKKCE